MTWSHERSPAHDGATVATIDEHTAEEISEAELRIGHASLRFAGKLVSAAVSGLGFAWIAFTPRRRGLHDAIRGCLVVHRGSRDVLRRAAPSAPSPMRTEVPPARALRLVGPARFELATS